MADDFNQNNAQMQQAVADAFAAEKKKKKKKKLIIIAVIAVIVIALIALVSGGSSDEDSDKVESLSSTGSSQSAESTSSETTVKNQKIEKGNAITIDNELKISYTDCNTDFKDYDEYWGPSDGKKVISATFTIENVSDEDQYIDTIDCYADNKKCESFYGANDDSEDPFFNTISPGRSVSGTVYFEVDKNAKDVELEFENSLWNEDKVIFVVK